MRKNVNTQHIEGYVYQFNGPSGLAVRETGENSKNPGTVYIAGDLDIAVDEQALNVITVHFTYVTEQTKQNKPNSTFTTLKKIIDAPEKSWISGGKENAFKVKVDSNALALNDFVSSDGKMVAAKRNEGGFVTIVNELCDEAERNTFQMDMIITRVNHVDADAERNINSDYTTVGGAVFNFRNDLLPVEFAVRNAAGMNYFENLGVTAAEPVYTKVWGRINSMTTKIEREEESAFGEASVTTYERKSREWVITGTAKVPYDFGDENVMTVEELTKAMQDREVHLAEVRKRTEEYQASKTPAAAAPATTATKNAGFTF